MLLQLLHGCIGYLKILQITAVQQTAAVRECDHRGLVIRLHDLFLTEIPSSHRLHISVQLMSTQHLQCSYATYSTVKNFYPITSHGLKATSNFIPQVSPEVVLKGWAQKQHLKKEHTHQASVSQLFQEALGNCPESIPQQQPGIQMAAATIPQVRGASTTSLTCRT